MTGIHILKTNGNTNPFDDFFIETHGGTMKDIDDELVWEEDCDSCEENSYDNPESNWFLNRV